MYIYWKLQQFVLLSSLLAVKLGECTVKAVK